MKKVLLAASFLTVFAACTQTPPSNGNIAGGDTTIVDSTSSAATEVLGGTGKQEVAVDPKLGKKYAGKYKGNIPNADGTAKTTLVLNDNGTFKLTELFTRAGAKPLESTGHWSGESGRADVISLRENNIEPYKKFKTEGKQLRQLTQEGKVIEGEMKDLYLLKKTR